MSCGGIKHRIEKNQDYYDHLSSKDQALIAEKKIKPGFSPKMVAIAWGNPSEKKFKETTKKATETWIYGYSGTDYETETLRVYNRSRHRYQYERVDVPYEYYHLTKYVVFENGKVSEYEWVNEKYAKPSSWRYFYNDPCDHFGIRSSFGCQQFSSMLRPRLMRLKK